MYLVPGSQQKRGLLHTRSAQPKLLRPKLLQKRHDLQQLGLEHVQQQHSIRSAQLQLDRPRPPFHHHDVFLPLRTPVPDILPMAETTPASLVRTLMSFRKNARKTHSPPRNQRPGRRPALFRFGHRSIPPPAQADASTQDSVPPSISSPQHALPTQRRCLAATFSLLPAFRSPPTNR